MADVRRYHHPGIIAVVVILAAGAWAAEKPTSPPKTCVTEDCHADYAKKAYVHGPVSLGDCKSCHEAVDPNAHAYAVARTGRDLCEYCHLDQAAKEHVHEPLTTGDCAECHDPRLFYAPFSTDNYALCFSCHPESLVLTERTGDLTDFRNGDVNLHYVHVHKHRLAVHGHFAGIARHGARVWGGDGVASAKVAAGRSIKDNPIVDTNHLDVIV